VIAINKLKSNCLDLVEEWKKSKEKSKQKISVLNTEDVKNKFDIVDSSKDDSEDKEESNEEKEKETLTPSTDAKLKQFFTSIQQENDSKEEKDDLEDYISKLENTES